ncbi:hypothetical protein MN116_006023 [Schistosoma mekongi]|uniref:Nuclear pore complex protein Nup85 n=1 Tax=Schistosoma mekongi TaxID=38744 RepID=A0AAE2D3Z6_SCHME|nr:hypothetical protein MN116_006023 [Schistosoma mekongi]
MEGPLVVGVTGPLSHVWVSENELGVFRKSDASAIPICNNILIENVKWGTSMYNDEFMRRLVKSSFEVFTSLQKSSTQNSYVNHSIQYRAALAVCSNEIFTFLKSCDEKRAAHLLTQGNLIQSLELLWHLAELIFIQVSPPGYLAFSLCSWFYVQSQEAANCAREILDNANKEQTGQTLLRDKLNNLKLYETNKHFWPTVLSLVLQARCQEAASLLVLHSNSNGRGLRSLRQLLASMPIASHTEKEGMWTEYGAQFSQAWNYWQSECEHRLSSGEFDYVGGDQTSVDYVKLIVNVLSGRTSIWDDQRILEVTKGSRGWFFRFVSFVFYTDQLVNVDGLSGNLDRWLSLTKKESTEPGSHFDQSIDALITSIFHVDLFSFVRIASGKLCNWWFIAHFANLLNHIYPGVLNDLQLTHKRDEISLESCPKLNNKSKAEFSESLYQPVDSSSLVEFFLLGYVESLASETSLLSIALGYLDHCKSGRTRQSALLLKHAVPVSTRATNWFISQAKVRELHSTGEEIAKLNCRRFTRLSLQSNIASMPSSSHYSPICIAAGWALMARDYSIVNRLAELSLARDSGFMCKDTSNGANTSPASTEVAELAAIILGFCRGSSAFDVPSCNNINNKTNEVNHLQLSPELAFLIRYAELQQYFNDGDGEGAVDRLIDLLVTSPGSSLINSTGQDCINASTTSVGLRIPTRLKIRLLAEVRHLLGRNCLRRDQVEVLITTLIELRADLDVNSNDICTDNDINPLLAKIHISLAKELASTFFTTFNNIPMSPSLSPNSAVDTNWR